MRVAAAGEKLFRQRNQRNPGADRFVSIGVRRTGSRRKNPCTPERLLNADAGGPGKNVLACRFAFAAERLIGRVLRQQSPEIRFRPKVAGSYEAVQSEIASLGAFQRIVPLVANIGKSRSTHAGWQRQQREFAGVKIAGKIAGPHPPEVEAVGQRTRPRPCVRLRSRAAELLPQVDLPFQPLGSKSGNIQAVIVKNCVDQLELFVVKQLWNLIADQTPLLQPPHMGLKRYRPVPTQKIKPGDIEADSRAESSRTLRPGSSGLEFQSNTVGEGIAFGFFHLN